ncbi:prepilin peptidase [Paramicrobacterium agarici]|uniref:Leader peptidase (Prepilin peptidase)/N-methyltransferase n=1 Tax=Paramicrobacterium agarici TaxID=630514 RepID=A0A2A9DSJ8_9MICO|nr:A24 family peptidase [Microbacterium agarici]PFG29563.1 leader peptidase (prepilin peptidase)/N-methyltransferase [Microbacterium agarici]
MADWVQPGVIGAIALVAGFFGHRMLWRRLPRLATAPTPSLGSDVLAGAITGAAAVALAPLGTNPAGAVAYGFFAIAGVQLSLIDARLKLLPNVLVLPTAGISLALLAATAAAEDAWLSLGRAVAGGAALFVAYLVLALVSPSGIGMGDVKLSVVAGVFLAYQGWMPLVVGAAAGFVIGALVGLALLAARKANRHTTVPFGPSMLGGAVLVLASIPAGLFAL